MSAKHQSITSLDDRVARMSDLRVLVDTFAEMMAVQDARMSELEARQEAQSRPTISSAPEVPDGA